MNLELDGAGGPVGWKVRKQLSRPVRVDPRAEPDDADILFYEDSDEETGGPSPVGFPESICGDDLSPDDFTEYQIEQYEEKRLPDCPETLLIYVGDAIFFPDHLRGDGKAEGFAIGGEFFEALDRHAKTLDSGSPDTYRPGPEGFLAERYIPSESGKKKGKHHTRQQQFLRVLKLDHEGPSEEAETVKFNVLRERPEHHGAFEYLGICSFKVDRSPKGISLTTTQFESLEPCGKPDIYPLGEWSTVEDAQRRFDELSCVPKEDDANP
ncbi:hypothetical protein K488DRAFT_70712 [Vararia minispora EC-137]|uniref:Uncharacterized protein n=1 Tax=Vararia minispora EC-137 TaxID=1314806 RepID=A0ACB8QKZ7_9AGAM|nr:hypothetical protein K488DRAFT_70712 [Vararia minispora EC-137]